MLAVFDKSVAKSPEALQISDSSGSISALKGGFLASEFANLNPGSVIVNLPSAGVIAHSLDQQNPFLPRLHVYLPGSLLWWMISSASFKAMLITMQTLKTANEAVIVIEAYRTLRDHGLYPPEQVVRDFSGKFSFILYDSSAKCVFLGADDEGSSPFYWGTDADGCLVLSDDVDIVKKGCGKSFAPFPKGCFFTTSGGLRSFEHPSKELKPVPRIDSQGDECGTTFKVDQDSKEESSGMKKVGSEANWSSNY